MTRKHFELVAAALKAANASPAIVLALAAGLATTNARFDKARFMEACGIDPLA